VDAWVYGYYNLGMPVSWSGDIPTPNYPSWPSLCNANLHEKITLPDATAINAQDAMAKFGQWPPQEFATVLPNDFYQFWIGAYSDVYGAAPASLSFSEFNGAYILSWLILWFQTSAESLGCNQAPPMKPPVTCAKKPGWVQPAAEPGDNGSGQQPPTPNPKVTVSGGEEACGYLLAILGIALFDGFAGPPATAAFNGGVSLIVNAHVPDWNQLQCLLYWYQLYLYNGLDDVHQMGTLGAFLYPYASELAIGQVSIPFLVGLDQYDTGATLVKSLGPETNIQFPSMPWSSTSGGTWIRVPNSGQGNDPGVEAQHTVAYQDDGKYPSWFITDNPSAARIRGGGKWPEATSTPGVPAEFGSAVTEAVDLLTHLGDEFPNFNLDADRGQAYFTWQIPAGSYTPPTSPIGIGPES
jgi:hypothetical protein